MKLVLASILSVDTLNEIEHNYDKIKDLGEKIHYFNKFYGNSLTTVIVYIIVGIWVIILHIGKG